MFRNVVVAVARCRFEGGDMSGDELTLQKLVDFLLLAMRNRLSVYLGDADVCVVVETCFTICVVLKKKELLKRQAKWAFVDF